MPIIHALPTHERHVGRVLTGACEHLAAADPQLASLIQRIGPCGFRRRPGGFGAIFHSILGQQLSTKAAGTIRGRLTIACGGVVTPESLLGLQDSDFAAAGVSRPKARYLRALAQTVREDPRFFERLARLGDEAVIERLTGLLGVGRWTAEMYLIFVLGRLDVLPLGDVSIIAAASEVLGVRRTSTARRLPKLARPWQPYRSVAVWYLYAHLDTRRSTQRTQKSATKSEE
ncbi:MAG TPA: DNA-3-methyladenine glycosylase 2 family protein [Stellaceae bacterium]|nr:DNA-3-methyladenine glycosylase 2 family protein [Stellaceae bacterium]